MILCMCEYIYVMMILLYIYVYIYIYMGGPLEYISYEFVPTSPAVSSIRPT